MRYIFMRVQNRFDPAVEAFDRVEKSRISDFIELKSMSVSTYFPPWCDLRFIFSRHSSQIHLDRNKNRYTNIRVRVNWGHLWAITCIEWLFLSCERFRPIFICSKGVKTKWDKTGDYLGMGAKIIFHGLWEEKSVSDWLTNGTSL